jgi:Tesmin/TSO1-like CXC domain, cysteine-rich domain
MGHSSGAKPRKLWNGTGDASGQPMRLELGGSSSLKNKLDDINFMMRVAAAPPPRPAHLATPHTGGRPPYHTPYPPHASYRSLNTPMKLEPSPVQTKANGGMGTLSNKRSMPPTTGPMKSDRDSKVPRTDGKENITTPAQPVLVQAPSTQQKRNPCNCKKSRCLKLYCECFAAELFCDGCNCVDCQNTETHVSLIVAYVHYSSRYQPTSHAAR